MVLSPVTAISTGIIVLLVVLAVLIGILIAVSIWGSKKQKESEEAERQLRDAAQPINLLVLDKKRVKADDAKLPAIVRDQMPKFMRKTQKLYIVRAKAGNRVMDFMCDPKVFEIIPVKQEVRAMVGGIYIVSVKGVHGTTLATPPEKKKGLRSRCKKN